jgi:hypothetical protein
MSTSTDVIMLLAQVALVVLVAVAYIGSIGWAFQDAEARGKSGWLVALIVAVLSWPIGLILWLVFRPAVKQPRQESSLRTVAIQCQCGKRILVNEGMAGTKLHCPNCGREVRVPELPELRKILAEEGFGG